jgi:hypothetical protein
MMRAQEILASLDDAELGFPCLDNGYVYLAATRLSLHRSATDWAIVFEVFGFMPRAGVPDVTTYTFSSRIEHRARLADMPPAARTAYLATHPHSTSGRTPTSRADRSRATSSRCVSWRAYSRPAT